MTHEVGAVERRAILNRTKSVTLVGASANPARPSYFVATYLLSSTRYEVNFVTHDWTRCSGNRCTPH